MKLWSWIKQRFAPTSLPDPQPIVKSRFDRALAACELPPLMYWSEIRLEQEVRECAPDDIYRFVCCAEGHPTQALANEHARELRAYLEKVSAILASFETERCHESHAPRVNDPKYVATENPSKVV